MMGTIKRTFWMLALLLQSSLLFSTATVSGNLKDLTGTNVSTRTFVRFRLAGCSYQAKASGVALVTPYEKDFTPAADGSISGTLYRNDTEISCLDQLDTTWYEVTVYRDGKPQKPTPYRVAAATFNLNTAAPMTTTNVPAARDAVVVNPTALQTINTHPLAFGAGSGISANYQGSVVAAGHYLKSNGTNFVASALAASGVGNCSVAGQFVSALNGDATPTCSGPPGGGANGVIYNTGSAFASTAAGGAGTLCLVSTDGGAPAFSSCAGSASTAWSSLSAPSANLALNMGQRTTTFSWGTGTGTTPLLTFDGSGGNGTGSSFLIKGQPSATIFRAQSSASSTVFDVTPAGVELTGTLISKTANPITFSFPNPAAPRQINYTDPGGNDDIVYRQAAQTLSGKTIGSGLNDIAIPFRERWLAGTCQNASPFSNWNFPTTNAPTVACGGPGNPRLGAVGFSNSGNQTATIPDWLMPSDAGMIVQLTFYWYAAATSGNVTWVFDAGCTGGNQVVGDESFSQIWAPGPVPPSGISNGMVAIGFSGITLPCNPGDLLTIKIKRTDTDATVTTAYAYLIEMVYTRTM